MAPLSAEQEQIWYFSRLAPENPVYNETVSITMRGALDVAALRGALDQFVQRHEIWRSTFPVIDGEPVQVVHEAQAHELPLLNLGDAAAADLERGAVERVSEAARRPYDLSSGPLLRPLLLRLDADLHRLYLAMHHLLFDAFTLRSLLLPELHAAYTALLGTHTAPPADSPFQYGDFAAWQQTWINSPEIAPKLDHWRKRLAAAPGLQLPTDHRRPGEQSFRGRVVPIQIGARTANLLRQAGREAGATLFDTLAAAFAMLLQRYSSQDDIVFGTAVDQRQWPELQSMAGYCTTPLVLRIDVRDDEPFSDLTERVRNERVEAMNNRVAFDRLLRGLQLQREPGANPVFQAFLTLEPQAVTF